MRRNDPKPDIPIDIGGLHAAYARGLEPALVVDRVFESIAAADDPGIFISLVDRRSARKAAQKLGPFDVAKPLWGIPFAVKDNIDAAGLPTTAACPAFAYTAKVSATVVERALAAGALLIGKTNLDQFATGLVGVRTPYPSLGTCSIPPSCRADPAQGRPSPWRWGSCPSRSAPTRRARAACRRG